MKPLKIMTILFSFILASTTLASDQRTNISPLPTIIEEGPISVEKIDQENFEKKVSEAKRVEQSYFETIDQGGIYTLALSPCFTFIILDKESGQPFLMSHYEPSSSTASAEEVQKAIEGHLDQILLKVEEEHFENDNGSEDEISDDQTPLYEEVSIVILGGKNPDSSNTMTAIREAREGQYFPITHCQFDLAKQEQVLDVYADNTGVYYHIRDLVQEEKT